MKKEDFLVKVHDFLIEIPETGKVLVTLIPDACRDCQVICHDVKILSGKYSSRITDFYVREFKARRFVKGRTAQDIPNKEYIKERSKLIRPRKDII